MKWEMVRKLDDNGRKLLVMEYGPENVRTQRCQEVTDEEYSRRDVGDVIETREPWEGIKALKVIYDESWGLPPVR